MIQRILVPVDFSTSAVKALDYAVHLAAVLGGGVEITLLHVVEPVYYSAPDITGGAATMAELFEEQRRQARVQLRRLEERYAKAGVSVRAVLQAGTAYQAIADTAERLKTDLIVIGTHGRTGLSHLLMGSVAERVVRTAPCPVLTVNPSRQRRRLPAVRSRTGTRTRRAPGRRPRATAKKT